MGDVTPKENEASLGPARPQWTRMGRTYPTRGLGVRQELCVVWFYCNLVSADCFCWQPITANSSPFHLETWGYGTAVQKVGYEYPSYSPKLRVQSTHSCFSGTFCTDFIGAFPGFSGLRHTSCCTAALLTSGQLVTLPRQWSHACKIMGEFIGVWAGLEKIMIFFEKIEKIDLID